ncbi:MAG TPA: ABC transporter permease [Gemmatimonadales bacterium]|nr:ABC transporter permease [Gemmatimonadales bacterium]
MSRVQGLIARLRAVLRPSDAEGRMEEEFSFHLEMEQARLVREGLPPEIARRQAQLTFGGLDAHRETMRDERGARWLDDLGADLRYALRAMRRSPGYALAVALTLGVGIGVNGIVVGYVNALLFRPIPARAPEQLVALFQRDTRTGRIGEIGYEDYLDYRERSGAFAGLAGMSGVPLNVAIPGASGSLAGDMVWGEMVTENYFTVLGMAPAAGRFFQGADAHQGANPFVVVSYDCWRRRFQADRNIVGRVVRLNGTEFTITGVAPRGFRGLRMFGFWPEMWVPIGMHAVIEPGSAGKLEGRGGGDLMVFGRMKPGADRAKTRAAAEVFARQLAGSYPATNADLTAMLVPAGVGFDHPAYVKPSVLVLSSALGLFGSLVILAIICANLANLQLARAAARARETAIRLSLGCSRARLIRQLLVESSVLALPGCAIALALLQANRVTERYLVPKLQFEVGLATSTDARVLLFTVVVAVLAVGLFGLVPALRASRVNVVPLAASAETAWWSGGRPTRLRRSLVVTQLALSVVLLVGGMLFVRSLVAARAMDLGFDARDRALVSFNVGLQGYDERRGQAFYDAVLARVRALPGIAAAGLARPVPFDSYGQTTAWYIGDLANSRDGTARINTSVTSDGFIAALGLRLADGRDFTPGDSANAPLVMIVGRSVATRLWPGRIPLGQQVRYAGAEGPQVTVVGVVDDAKFAVIGDAPGGHLYLPVRQHYRDWQTLVVHTRGDPAAMLLRLEGVLASLDPALPAFGKTTLEEAVANGLSTSRTAATIAGFFGVLALLIASVGLYALVAGAVAERTREIGVRLALGCTPVGVLRLMMGEGARLGVIGLGIGLVGAFGVARAMGGLLYGLSPSDPVTFVLVPLTLGVVVLFATYVPARRAVRLDPVAALRSE